MNKQEFLKIIRHLSVKFLRYDAELSVPETIIEELWDPETGIGKYQYREVWLAINKFVNTERGKELTKFRRLPEVSDIKQFLTKKNSRSPLLRKEAKEDFENKLKVNQIHSYIVFQLIGINPIKEHEEINCEIEASKIVEMVKELDETVNVEKGPSQFLYTLLEGIRGLEDRKSDKQKIKDLKNVYKNIYNYFYNNTGSKVA